MGRVRSSFGHDVLKPTGFTLLLAGRAKVGVLYRCTG
jgi:hypothetical protein